MIKDFTLIEKRKLTNDLFEIVFETKEWFDFKSGQFITFLLPYIWWRAYSILEVRENKLKLIIKRLENWRWWSKFICDSIIWDNIKWVWPAWHFTLRENNKNKLFIWTWTWFVPLFNQINKSIFLNLDCKLKLLFWLRNDEDIFYENELIELKKNYKNFDFEYYISKEHDLIHNFWRVTDFLTKNNIAEFEEFYICWNPYMIEDSIKILENLWIEKNHIYTEKF